MNILKSFMKTPLHTKIFAGLILGIPAGLILGPRAEAIKPIGDIFIRLIWMIVVPLVFASIFVGTASLGDLRKLGRIGAKTIVYYLVTTAIAITIGLVDRERRETGRRPQSRGQGPAPRIVPGGGDEGSEPREAGAPRHRRADRDRAQESDREPRRGGHAPDHLLRDHARRRGDDDPGGQGKDTDRFLRRPARTP